MGHGDASHDPYRATPSHVPGRRAAKFRRTELREGVSPGGSSPGSPSRSVGQLVAVATMDSDVFMSDLTDELRHVTQRFFRRFGVLSSDGTPWKPLSTSHAHALMVLMAQGIPNSDSATSCASTRATSRASARRWSGEPRWQRPSDHDGRVPRLAHREGRTPGARVDMASRERFDALLGRVPKARRSEIISALRCLVDALDDLSGATVEKGSS